MQKRAVERAARSTREGFTLIEVLLVVAILGILAGVAAISFKGKIQGANIARARADIHNIGTAVKMFELNVGRYPSSLQELVSQPANAPNWQGPYFEKGRIPVDPWGNEYQYKTTEQSYDIVSAGPDAQFGSGDDLTN